VGLDCLDAGEFLDGEMLELGEGSGILTRQIGTMLGTECLGEPIGRNRERVQGGFCGGGGGRLEGVEDGMVLVLKPLRRIGNRILRQGAGRQKMQKARNANQT